MRKLPILVGSLMCAVAAQASAQTADPSLGARIVRESCSACHQIGPNEPARDPRSKAPDFIEVAKLPSTTELSIKVFLRSSHRSMPNFILSAEEIDSIAAYIVGLKQK